MPRTVRCMTTENAVILELLKRHVLWDDEPVERLREWPDGIAVTTPLRHLSAGSEPGDWTISRTDWVDDVVIATRDDLIVDGAPERFGFLMLTDGTCVYVNDQDALAALGRRLGADLDPLAYAELLVQFHPYSSAHRSVLTEPIDGIDGVQVAPPELRQTPEGMTLRFTSSVQYRPPLSAPLLDLMAWTVTIPHGEPARWDSHPIAEGLRILVDRKSRA